MKVTYWIATAALCVFMTLSAFRYLSGSPIMVEKFRHLGYPDYFRQMLGFAKALGVVALLVPIIPATLREWAYAGFTFDLLGAAGSHVFARDSVLATALPLTLLVPLLVSHRLRLRLWARLPSHDLGDAE